MERRRAVRYRIEASVVFSWPGPTGRLQGEGVTRDISGFDIYIQTSACPPPAVTAQMEIFLPAMKPSGNPLKVTIEGQVIRVEHREADETPSGFAVLMKGLGSVDIEAKKN